MTTSLIAGYCCRSGSRRVDVRASDAGDEKPSGWFTRDEVRDQLEAYRRANPGTLFAGVSVVEMTEGGTAARQCSVYDFIDAD